MNILLIGCGPLPDEHQSICSFGQLRTWSIRKALLQAGHTVQQVLLDLGEEAGTNAYDKSTLENIHHLAQQCEAVVTAGPFLPALVLDAVPPTLPLWLDWPSDPLADQHAKRQQVEPNPSEEAIVQEVVNRALNRADAIGVISERQMWATIGQLLITGREDVPTHVVPIAFDFLGKVKRPRPRSNQILLSGSLNTWLDLEHIVDTIHHHGQYTLHVTGGVTENFPQMADRLQRLCTEYADCLVYHGWLSQQDLSAVTDNCHLATWLDHDGIEPLLGSRTRALFYIWKGLRIFGSTTTELGQQLCNAGHLTEWHQHGPIDSVLEAASALDVEAAQQYCTQHFAPTKVYQPLLTWLTTPTSVPAGRSSCVAQENQRLRTEIQAIYNSKTWRVSNRLHRLLRSAHR